MKLLVIDDDSDMVEMLTSWLKTRGYEVSYALNTARARAMWEQEHPDLAIVDIHLKDGDALALCREMRAEHDALVLAVSLEHGMKTEVYSLEAGADAFLEKPFLPVQLLAYINSLGRRLRTSVERRPSRILDVGPFHIDTLRNMVTIESSDKSVRIAHLTPTESKILHLLAASANDVCTLSQIVTRAWGYADSGDTYLVKAHIRHLREKLEEDPSTPRYLVTITGVGYSLRRKPDSGVLALESPFLQREHDQRTRRGAERLAELENRHTPQSSPDTYGDQTDEPYAIPHLARYKAEQSVH